MTQQRDQFIAMYRPAAERVASQLKVPADGVLNHWGLETGWGKSVIPGTNNLGNIKDFSGGGTAATDNMTKSRDRYRQYQSVDDFATDYTKLIGSNPRYAAALNTNTAYDFANGLQRGGYAEDPNFARKVAGMPAIDTSTSVLPNTARKYGITGDNLKSTQVSPADMAAIAQIQRDKASMLPLALGAMISSNRGMQNFGNRVFGEAMEGVDPYKIGKGAILPSGQFISEQTDMDILRQMQTASKVDAEQQQLAPADVMAGGGGVAVVDPNAPWRGLNERQAQTMKAQTLANANKQLETIRSGVAQDGNAMLTMDQFGNHNRQAATGGLYDKLAPDWAHTGDTSAMIAAQNKLTPLQRPEGSGATSDFEQKLYKSSLPNIGNTGNVNAQIRISNEAIYAVRQARLDFYEKYLAQHGHINGAAQAFEPTVKAIEAKYQPMIDAYGSKNKASQVSNQPTVGALPKSKAAANGGFSIEPAGN